MAGWIDPDGEVLSSATALARELADPLRLTALQLLAAEGPHTLTQLADAIGVSAPRLANHLARLRAAGLVEVEHAGRHALYRVAAPGLGEVLAALSRYAGGDQGPSRPSARPRREPSPDDVAHTCYGHAAGRLGVALFATLVERDALRPPDGSRQELELGAGAAAGFADLGLELEPDAGRRRRRKLATACLDKTYRLPHLGGLLGEAALEAMVARGLVTRVAGTRSLRITPAGAAELPALLTGFSPAR